MGATILVLPAVVGAAASALRGATCWLLKTVLPPVLTLAILSAFMGLVLGEKARGALARAWMTAGRACLFAILAVLKLLWRLLS